MKSMAMNENTPTKIPTIINKSADSLAVEPLLEALETPPALLECIVTLSARFFYLFVSVWA